MDESVSEPLIVRRQALPQELTEVVDLFDEAFSLKFAQAVKNPVRRKKLWATVINLNQVTVALQGEAIVGMMLLSYENSPGFRKVNAITILRILGLLRTIRAAFIFFLFSALDWKPTPTSTYLEAISVSSAVRGLGLGSLLLADSKKIAKEAGSQYLDLSVVLENQAAKKLYLKQDFEVLSTKQPKLLGMFTGVSGADVMRCRL